MREGANPVTVSKTVWLAAMMVIAIMVLCSGYLYSLTSIPFCSLMSYFIELIYPGLLPPKLVIEFLIDKWLEMIG